MKFLLDTNICIYIIKSKPQQVIEKFKKLKPGSVAISAITICELYYGVFKSKKPEENLIALQEFLSPLIKIDFDNNDALCYGKLRTELEAKGTPIGSMDMLIAAHALCKELVLVTNNEKEFTRISDLIVENWVN